VVHPNDNLRNASQNVTPDSHASAGALPEADIVAEAARVLAAGHDTPLRLVGGLAIALVTRPEPLLPRDYKDIDFVTTRKGRTASASLFTELGYEPDETFNALNGNRRLLFYDRHNGRQVDIFVGSFEMCHVLPIEERLLVRRETLGLVDLLLTKLQIFSLNEKDQRDILNLLYRHPLSDVDDEGINLSHLAGLCAADWGLWRTVTLNLERVRGAVRQYELTDEQQELITSRVDDIRRRIDAQPKRAKWKLRARVGERMRWYEEPEEVQ